MKVILFGATGMVGQGALIECLEDPGVERVLAVVRRPTGTTHPKLVELVHQDFFDWSSVEAQLTGYDACFFCLGTSAAGMSEAEYRRVTQDLTRAAAQTLLRRNPGMAFVYVSGQGTDGTGKSRMMWARVKGEVENELLGMPFAGAYMFRPGVIQPVKGVVSSTLLYRVLYAALWPLVPLLRLISPSSITTSAIVGRAMIRVVRDRRPSGVLEAKDINAVGAAS
jgi:uncharacterized protein YbjT (DUF2867 family)